MNKYQLSLAMSFLSFGLFAQSMQVQQLSNGVFDCFPEGTKEGNQFCYCETSAVVFYGDAKTGGDIYLASDKGSPNGASPVFHTAIKPVSNSISQLGFARWKFDGRSVGFVEASPLRDAKKYEDFALSPDKSWVFAMTGFDRVDASSNKMDAYNMLLAWQPGKEDKAQIVSSTNNGGVQSSVGLRQNIEKALATHYNRPQVPYFKMEGLAAIPGNKLLFGVREMGNKYDDFEYQITLIQVSYSLESEKIVLAEDWTVAYSFPVSPDPELFPGLVTPMGLSSVEYDPHGKRLYLLTSHELPGSEAGAYMWVLSDKDFKSKKAPQLVYYKDKPLHFSHKAEDITPLAKDEVFIIHDDDRALDFGENEHRLPHQAAFTLVLLGKKGKKS